MTTTTGSDSSGSGGGAGRGNAIPIGTRIGTFEINDVLGEGGFGIVYAAFDHSLHRRIALKEYMPNALANRLGDCSIVVRSQRHEATFRAGLKSFLNEARMLADFDHPALVKVLSFWEQNGTAYMTMPLYEGRTLRTVLRESPKPDEARLKALVAPLLNALETLHAAKCYHRDVAPDNILILENGAPVLLDFGAARRIIGDMTQAITVILKPGYAPLEQYADDPSLQQGPWTDIYAVAAVLCFAITGKPPPTPVTRIVSDTMKPLRDSVSGYSPTFLAGVDHGLAVRPEQRPQTIAEFRRALGIGIEAANLSSSAQSKPKVPTGADDRQTVQLANGPSALMPKADHRVQAENSRPAQAKLPAAADNDPGATRLMPRVPALQRGASSATSAIPAVPKAAAAAHPKARPNPLPPLGKKQQEATTGWWWKLLAAAIALGALAEGAILFWGLGDQSRTPLPDSHQTAPAVVKGPAPVIVTPPPPAVVVQTPPSAVTQAPPAAIPPVAATPADSANKVEQYKSPMPQEALVNNESASREALPAPHAQAPPVIGDSNPAGADVAKGLPPLPKSTDTAIETRSTRPPIPTGVVLFSIRPWGEIVIDGRQRAYSPPTKRLVLPEGRYKIEIRNGAFPSLAQSVEVKAGSNVTIEHTFK